VPVRLAAPGAAADARDGAGTEIGAGARPGGFRRGQSAAVSSRVAGVAPATPRSRAESVIFRSGDSASLPYWTIIDINPTGSAETVPAQIVAAER
jgi:hypothetical protein